MTDDDVAKQTINRLHLLIKEDLEARGLSNAIGVVLFVFQAGEVRKVYSASNGDKEKAFELVKATIKAREGLHG